MTKKYLQARVIRAYLSGEVKNPWRVNARELRGVTLRDLQTTADACGSGDYTAAHATGLYTNHGGIYCLALEIAQHLRMTA